MRITQRILLKGPRNRKPRVQLLRTTALICAIRAKLAFPAHARDPLDTGAVPDLPEIVHVGAYGDDDTRAFVPGDAAGDVGHLEGPFVVEERLVGCAEAGVVDLDEDLVGARLLDGDFLDRDGGRVAGALLNGCSLGFGEAHCVWLC
jgi:hypothetical protein